MKDVKYPTVVYKYRNWLEPLHRNVLFKNELYLSSPKDFNDPFDCRIPANFYLLDDDSKKEKYISRIINNNRDTFLQQGHSLDTLYSQCMTRLKENIKEEQAKNEKNHFEQQDERYGIISFGTRWSINLMWAHYANCHSGFCVGFKEPYMSSGKIGGMGGQVSYPKEFPKVDPNEEYINDEEFMKSVFRETHTKEKRWGYEKEYRVVKYFEGGATTNERIVKIDDSAFESISLGLWFPESEIQCVLNLAKEKQIPVYKMQKRQLSFKLYRRKIN